VLANEQDEGSCVRNLLGKLRRPEAAGLQTSASA
jgi:hypothetical protein